MDKKQSPSWWQAHRPSKRRLVQLYAALLYNAHLKGFLEGNIYTGPLKSLCVPGLNCYSCPAAAASCPLGALQNALAASGTRAPYYVLGILMLFGLTLGRMVCGWLCPFGLLQELVHKLPTPKLRKGRVTRVLSYGKYAALLVLVVALPLWFGAKGLPLPAFCKYICPAGTLEGAVGLLSHPANEGLFSMLGALFASKLFVLLLVLLACVFVFRAFCRFLCPLGAIYGLFARVSLLGVRVNAERCTRCGRCVGCCPMDIRRVGDHECVQCGACAGVCPTGAIEWKHAARAKRRQNERNEKPAKGAAMRRAAAWTAALLLLAGVMTAVHRSRQAAPAAQPEATSVLPVGDKRGMRCPSFAVPLYGGGTFAPEDSRGRVTVINFWATWCAPCVGELPYFQQLADTYPDAVTVAAIHSDLVTDDVEAYLARTGYTMPFALDADGTALQALSGSALLPVTVVLDRNGVIAYNQAGSMSYEALERLVLPLLADEKEGSGLP